MLKTVTGQPLKSYRLSLTEKKSERESYCTLSGKHCVLLSYRTLKLFANFQMKQLNPCSVISISQGGKILPQGVGQSKDVINLAKVSPVSQLNLRHSSQRDKVANHTPKVLEIFSFCCSFRRARSLAGGLFKVYLPL